ncbi:epoxide hydrolase N-terminal domain-containing protein [Streptomyces sp. NBC_01340]|uniref:epoxide hydrolase N-terminal domain-containing protein n=1 Tax=Streptomyces sp. NBC_01340 TaxID=2903830 RepID=UPI003DA257E4
MLFRGRRRRPLVEYWGTGYNWRTAEARLNALPQFITEIDGLDIPFAHRRIRLRLRVGRRRPSQSARPPCAVGSPARLRAIRLAGGRLGRDDLPLLSNCQDLWPRQRDASPVKTVTVDRVSCPAT